MSNPNYSFEFVTTSSDAVPADLQGSVYWYDTGAEVNSEAVYYDSSDTYAKWYDGAQWIISAISDVDGSPTDYFADIPATITIEAIDGYWDGDTVLPFDSIVGGKPKWLINGGSFLFWNTDHWHLDDNEGNEYNNTDDNYLPPKDGVWTGAGVDVDLSYTPNTTFIGFGAWSGALTLNEYVISDSWYRAETTAFDSLATYLNCTENANCFRGFLPVQGDGEDALNVDTWMMASGGSGEFDIDRLAGDGAAWCSLRADCRIDSLWETRQGAMKFAGAVMAWLKSTDNLNATGNVTWCRLTGIPAEPEIYRTAGRNRKRYWKQEMSLELIYKTESAFS